MILDFTEIPTGNNGGDGQDDFELFARDFLKSLGYDIVRDPSRGADGGQDLIVKDRSLSGEFSSKWLVSCKHYAKSGKSVTDKDEVDITDRLRRHNCHGFIGFYSTIASSALAQKLHENENIFPSIIFDKKKIEDITLKYKDLLASYFPISSKEYIEKYHTNIKSSNPIINEQDLLRIMKSAVIIVEIEKIKEAYWNIDEKKRKEIINQLVKYSGNHWDIHIAKEVFNFLYEISIRINTDTLEDVISSIYWTMLSFFRNLNEDDYQKDKIELAKQCINIADNIIYDTLIYLQNAQLARWGFLMLKLVYNRAKQSNIKELQELILALYDHIEINIQQRALTNLEIAQELINVFKSDLDASGIAFPLFPPNLRGPLGYN